MGKFCTRDQEELDRTFSIEIEAVDINTKKCSKYTIFSGYPTLQECIAVGIAGLRLISTISVAFVEANITLPTTENFEERPENIFELNDLIHFVEIADEISPEELDDLRDSGFWRSREGVNLNDWIELMRGAIDNEVELQINFYCENKVILRDVR